MKRRRKVIAIVVACVCAVAAGLWQIDLVRQNAEILWMTVSGRSWKLRGTLQMRRFWSPALQQSRRVDVYLPADYDSSRRRYPVLYLLHGSPGVITDWLRYGRAPQDMERLWMQKRIPETLLVIPDGNGIGYLGDSEYLDAPDGAGRPGAKMGTYIWKDLVQWVDGNYRTLPYRNDRTLCGVSTGGYGAVNLGLQHPELFGRLFSFSGYFDAEDSGWARPVWGHHPSAAALAEQSPLDYVRRTHNPLWERTEVVMVDGEGERPPYPQEALEFARVLAANHIPYVARTLPGRHSWDLWRAALTFAMTGRE